MPAEESEAHERADEREDHLARAIAAELRGDPTHETLAGTLQGALEDLMLAGYRIGEDQAERVAKAETPQDLRRRAGAMAGGIATRLLRNTAGFGLTDRQEQAVQAAFRAMIDRGVSQEEAVSRAAQLREDKRRQRARTIARTEAMRAVNQGMTAAWHDALEGGGLDRRMVAKEWVTTFGQAACPICRPMDGKQRRVGSKFGPFRGPLSWVRTPPVHPQCRCVVRLVSVVPGELKKAGRGFWDWQGGRLVWVGTHGARSSV